MRLRRSWLLPRSLLAIAWASAPISSWIAGSATSLLWFVPWQQRRRRGVQSLPSARPIEVTVDGVRLAGWQAGAGPTVLLVHGWASTATSLAPLVEPLVQRGHRVVAFDLPAHGRSPGLRTSVPEFGRVIRGLVERFEAEAVLAHSLGALGTMWALRDRLGVHRVVLLAPVVRAEELLDRFTKTYRLPTAAVAGLRRSVQRRFGDGIWDELAADRYASSFDVPALLVHDRDDAQVPIEGARSLARSWPDARLLETSGLGHHRVLRDAGVVDEVVRFLE